MTAPLPPKKLLDVVREVIRLKHYSYRTEYLRNLSRAMPTITAISGRIVMG
jgi:hypothetical protein